jgi:hypothetical protein
MPAALPLIRWTTPTAVVRTFYFPDYVTDFSYQIVHSFIQSKTVGNVISHYPKAAYEEVSVEYLGDFNQAFADEVRAWWSHAARGGVFEFVVETDIEGTPVAYEFNDAVVLQSNYPLVEEPGLIMRFSLRCRDIAAIVTP